MPVNLRVIAATNVDLQTAVRERRFREDLYYRLNVVRFILPPLRERIEDVPQLAQSFLEKFNRRMGMQARIDDGVIESLMQYKFPGNVRELENIMEQAVALSGGGLIRPSDVTPQNSLAEMSSPQGRTLAAVVDESERVAIEDALRENDGNRERAAELLGISPTTLWRKMSRLGITYETR